jgi:hypothetical protein
LYFAINSTVEQITQAGFPTATKLFGMFFVTTLPEPIMQFFPILTPGFIIVFAPIKLFPPIDTHPPI